MSDPDRFVESSENEVERLLLRAGRDTSSPQARRRALLAATGVVTASTLSAGTATGAAAAGTAAMGAKAASLLSLKWVAVIGLASLGAMAGTVAVHRAWATRDARERAPLTSAVPPAAPRTPPAPPAEPHTSLAPPEAPRTPLAPPSNPTASPAATPPATPELSATADGLAPAIRSSAVTRTTHGGAPASTPVGSSAATELMLLDEARGALAAGDPSQALSILEAYRRRFPHAALAPEASVLRIEALVAAGDPTAASRAAQSFLQANPASPYAQRIRSVLESSNP
jgi:hypothetical protein